MGRSRNGGYAVAASDQRACQRGQRGPVAPAAGTRSSGALDQRDIDISQTKTTGRTVVLCPVANFLEFEAAPPTKPSSSYRGSLSPLRR